ncbi:MAG: NUDIX domain-containing protein, partial [Bacteroidota bacterium]
RTEGPRAVTDQPTGAPAIMGEETIFAGWNRLLMVSARTARGTAIRRSVEHHGDAAAVLPFDPDRRVATLVRQLRVALLYAHGKPSSLEVPAGVLDGDAPDVCAVRETMEEAGIALKGVIAVAGTFPMSGVSTEQIHLFLAEYSAADRVGVGGGLVEESEEIEVVEVPLADLAAMADAGTLTDLKTFALVQSLRLRRPELFSSGG